MEKLLAQRRRLVNDVNLISDGVERSSKNRMTETELFLHQLDRIVWPKIIDLSTAIIDHLVGDDELDREIKYQEELRKNVASIRFKAKLSNQFHYKINWNNYSMVSAELVVVNHRTKRSIYR